MPHVYVNPDNVEFSLPYSGGTGVQLKVAYAAKKEVVEITDCDEVGVTVYKKELKWLVEVLQDVIRLHEATVEQD